MIFAADYPLLVCALGAHKALWYLNIYAGLSGLQVAFEMGRTFLARYLSVRAADSLHATLLAKLLRWASPPPG